MMSHTIESRVHVLGIPAVPKEKRPSNAQALVHPVG
jgi:hypothetical protein